MKRITMLCLCLSLGTTVFAATSSSRQDNDGFAAFWQKFKTAVISGDKATVAALSKFPIGMPYGIRSIRNQADLNKRYREVFNEQTNAAKCFAKHKPERDPTNQKLYSVYCPDAGGNEVVSYSFERTKLGWKFVSLDNINE